MSNWPFLNAHRVQFPPYVSTPADGFNGAFAINVPGEVRKVCIIGADGYGWQHVSVSFGPGSTRAPSWAVMCFVKQLFWGDEDAVIQIHPPKSQYVNYHPGCLHLWRCTDGREQPLPPSILVGPKPQQ